MREKFWSDMKIKLASRTGGLIVAHTLAKYKLHYYHSCKTNKVNSQIILFVFFPILNTVGCTVTAVTVQTMPVFDGNKADIKLFEEF